MARCAPHTCATAAEANNRPHRKPKASAAASVALVGGKLLRAETAAVAEKQLAHTTKMRALQSPDGITAQMEERGAGPLVRTRDAVHARTHTHARTSASMHV